jgi:metallophosphoesterase superfamily enzyme
VWIESARLLIVSDVHWGYAISHRAQGNLLPLWGDDEINQRLQALITDYDPVEMIWLGDSLHTLDGRPAAERFMNDSPVPVTVVRGNHDVAWSLAADCHSVVRGRFFCHHGDAPREVPPGLIEVVGHHHPALVWSDGAGTHLKLPVLVVSEKRLVLPAFSPWAAGSPWRRAEGETLHAIGTKRIFAVAPDSIRR